MRWIPWTVQAYVSPQAALAALCEQHSEGLYRYAASLTANREAAQDAVQEVFLRLAGQAGSLHRIRHPKVYLYRAVRNELARNQARSKRYWNELPAEELMTSNEMPTADRIALLSALQSLPQEQREAVLLKDVLGWTFREIAEMLELSLNTVASRHRYAMSKLRAELTPALEESLAKS